MVKGVVTERCPISLLMSALLMLRNRFRRFLVKRLNVLRYACHAMAESQIRRQDQADARIRVCIASYEFGDQVLLNAKNLPTDVVSAVFKIKLKPRCIGPLRSIADTMSRNRADNL